IRSRIVPVEIAAARRGEIRIVDRDDARDGAGTERREAAGKKIAELADGAAAVVLAEKAWAGERGIPTVARVRIAPIPEARAWGAFRFVEADVPEDDDGGWAPPSPDMEQAPAINTGVGLRPGHATGADGAALVVDLVALLTSGGGGAGYAYAAGGWGESVGIRVEV
ncbi:MAG TPA: hypothetical protein VE404_02190, partial [Verrucomicrobiae bacterium]|nr:hypothetical protein [Verrucomicrobiae bacterium]